MTPRPQPPAPIPEARALCATTGAQIEALRNLRQRMLAELGLLRRLRDTTRANGLTTALYPLDEAIRALDTSAMSVKLATSWFDQRLGALGEIDGGARHAG